MRNVITIAAGVTESRGKSHHNKACSCRHCLYAAENTGDWTGEHRRFFCPVADIITDSHFNKKINSHKVL